MTTVEWDAFFALLEKLMREELTSKERARRTIKEGAERGSLDYLEEFVSEVADVTLDDGDGLGGE